MQLKFKKWAHVAVALVATLCFVASVEILVPVARAQTEVTAQLSGVVTDSAGGLVQNATVTIVDTSTGDKRVLTTNAEGRYLSPFMQPHAVTVSASAPGLQSDAVSTQLLVGQQSVANLTVSPTGSKQTVTVSANNAQLIDTQSANLTTTFTTHQFQNLPSPGFDITTIAYTVPGVAVVAGVAQGEGGGTGNFVSNGIPGNSNLFVINGADYMSLSGMVNNSGASNLAIGAAEMAQASVVQNGYSVQYGRVAGAIVTYTTKSGTNEIHGLAQWDYNSDGLNANDFFNNLTGVPRSKAVSNQYAAQMGGPILKNKLFGFMDYEGIRFVLPSVNFVNFPTAQLQNTILNTVSTQSAALYGQMFKLLQTAPSYATAQPVTNGTGALQDASNTLGCGSLAGTPVYGEPNTYFGAVPTGAPGSATAIPCVNAVRTAASAQNTEWRLTSRVDYDISDKQSVYFRFIVDRGVQQTFTSLINPVLNVTSPQPMELGQLNHTYVFNPTLTNQFIAAFTTSRAYRFPTAGFPAAVAASPVLLNEANDAGTNSQAGFGQSGDIGLPWNNEPGGGIETEYQAIDDLSWLKGNHNFKLGSSYLWVVDTYYRFLFLTYAGEYKFGDAADFAGGTLPGGASSSFNQDFNALGAPRISTYNLGVYVQDEWKAKPNLVIDYGLRVDRNGNMSCAKDCFSLYQGGAFPASGVTLDTPYNATLLPGQAHPLPSIQKAIVQPRAGFNWDVLGQGKSVLRGGIGLFATQLPGSFITPAIAFPTIYAPQVLSGVVGQGAGSANAFAAAANAAVTTGFSQGQNINQIAASLPAGVPFTPPTYFFAPRKFSYPTFLEWSLQMQQQLTPSDAIILSYAGNYGQHLLLENSHLNQSLGASAYFPATKYTSFGGLPAAPPDPRLATVTGYSSGAVSNYNGVSLVYKHISRRGITANLSYTWSHSLDDVSNNGQGTGIASQITPTSASALMYSNSDYDIRNSFVMDLTYVEPNRFASKLIQLAAGGWTVAAKAYWRSG
jgi:hypothetical protein